MHDLLTGPRVSLLLSESVASPALGAKLDALMEDLLDVVRSLLDKQKLIAAIDGDYIQRLQRAFGIPLQYLDGTIDRIAVLVSRALASPAEP